MSVLQLKPLVTAPLAISAWVVWPCSPDSALSPLRQCATGTDAAATAGSSVSSAITQEDKTVVFMVALRRERLREGPTVSVERTRVQVAVRQSGQTDVRETLRRELQSLGRDLPPR